MLSTSTAAGDVFNARDLAAPEVAARFLAPPVFERLLSKAHCILEGPRGSGKTTLLRMLTPEAFSLWREQEPGTDIEFIGVFVPADVRWAKQLAERLARVGSEVAKDALQQAVFSVSVSLALVDTIQRCSELNERFGAFHPDLFFGLQRADQAELVSALVQVWQLSVQVPSFNGIRLALRMRQHELSAAASQLGEGVSLIDIQRGYPYVTSTWLDNLVTAIESANDALGRPDQLWAILLDELEIVPPALLRTIVDALRSTSNKVRFKLALSPTGSDLIPLGESGSSSSFEDYRPLRLWYERKGDAREFASRLFAVSLKRSADSLKLSLGDDIDVHSLGRLLGVSWSPDSLDDDDDESSSQLSQATSEAPSLQRARSDAFASLYQVDESFKKLLDDKAIDPRAPPYKDETANGILVRKITQLVVHRDREIGSFTLAEGVKRRGGRRSPWAYYGYPNIIDLTEGNPRWVLTLAEALVSAAHSRGRPLSTMSVQSVAINEFVQQMCAKLKVYPTRAAATGRRWTPFDFVKALGLSIAETLFDGPFVTDPRLSFVVDQAAIEQFGDYIRTAIDLGALVIMRKGGPAPLAAGGDAQSLVGARVRLTYRLAPEFRLPLLYTKEKKLSLALRSGELLSDQTESKAPPPTNRLTAPDADDFDDGSAQRRLI